MILVEPVILTFFAVFILTPAVIALFKQLQLTQPIREELPTNHQIKEGTPLMLGIIFLAGIVIAFFYMPTHYMGFLTTVFFLFTLVGFTDDCWKATRQDPRGISGKAKLLFQFIFTITLLYYLLLKLNLSTEIDIFKNFSLNLSAVTYVILVALLIVGSANAINFTDGLDGLLSMVAIPTYFFFFIITDSVEIQLFTLVMIASLVAFLIYNLFPAKAFMGDTGSLAIGGSLAFLAIIEKVEILIPLLFFVYFAEQLSVIIQVSYFKLTRKRVFHMTPIHYHYALKYNWSENMIVIIFALVGWGCTLLSLGYWKFFLS